MSELKKFFLILSLAIAFGLGLTFLENERYMSFIFIFAGILILGLGGIYSILFLSKLIPALEKWLIKKEIILSVSRKGFHYTDAAMLIIALALTLSGLAIIFTNIQELFL